MRVSLRQVVPVVAVVLVTALPTRRAQASSSSQKVVEGGTIAIPMSVAPSRVVKPRTDCRSPHERQTAEGRVGRVLLRTPVQQKA